MLCFTIVTLVAQNRPVGKAMEDLPHVTRAISLFLLDPYAIELHQVIQHKDLALFQFLTGAGDANFGRGYAADVGGILRAVHCAGSSEQTEFLELLASHFSCEFQHAFSPLDVARLDWMLTNLAVADVQPAITMAAREGNLKVLKYLADKKLLFVKNAAKAVDVAVRNGRFDAVEFLAQHHCVECMQCVIESAVQCGFLKEAASLQREHLAASIAAKANNTKRKSHHTHHKPLGEFLRSEDVCSSLCSRLGTWRAFDELQWLAQHFPEVYKQIHHKVLFLASQRGDLSKVQWLYDHSPPVAYVTRKDRRQQRESQSHLTDALDVACSKGHLDVVTFLVNKRVAIDRLDSAIHGGNLALVRFLQEECGVARIMDLEDAIDSAVCSGHLEVVQWFDSQRVKPYPAKAFWQAAKGGNLAMLTFLLSHPHQARVYARTIYLAFHGGHRDCIKVLYTAMKTRENYTTQKTRMWSILNDRLAGLHDNDEDRKHIETFQHMEILHYLLAQEETLDPEQDFAEVIDVALRMRNLGLIKLLHEKHAKGFSIDHAVVSGSLAIVRFLHQDPDVCCTVAAMDLAIEKGYLHIVAFLDQHRTEGCSADALLTAATLGHWKIVRFLYERRRMENNLHNALLAACSRGHVEVVKYLTGRTVERDWSHSELLCYACSGSIRVVQWLVDTFKDELNDQAFTIAIAFADIHSTSGNQVENDKILTFLRDCASQRMLKRRRLVGSARVDSIT